MSRLRNIHHKPSRFGGWALFIVAAASLQATAAEPTIRINPIQLGKPLVVEVHGVSAEDVRQLRSAAAIDWPKLLQIRISGAQSDLLGSYSLTNDGIRFESRFTPAAGVKFRAVFDPTKLPTHLNNRSISIEEAAPKLATTASTHLLRIYPSANKLPENQLRFYLEFSAPMARGEAYSHLKLLDSGGKEVAKPFLELFEELWDADGKRFTLLLHPGRIKRGLVPRAELGPILEDGKSYSLVVSANWPDANGNKLRSELRKRFSVGPAREKQLDVAEWKIKAPAANSSGELEVQFPFPLDRGLLEHVISVVDDHDKRVAGQLRIGDFETRWKFTPDGKWAAGHYRLLVESSLEDTAGNSIARPFELDLVQPRPEEKPKLVAIEFEAK